MRVRTLTRRQVVRRSPDELFDFFADPRNLERITPPWLHFELRSGEREMHDGAILAYRLRLHGVPLTWVSIIEDWEPGHRFVDRQLHGPYRLWHHLHEVTPHPDGALSVDRVTYALPLGPLGEVGMPLVRRDLERIFDHRYAVIAGLMG